MIRDEWAESFKKREVEKTCGKQILTISFLGFPLEVQGAVKKNHFGNQYRTWESIQLYYYSIILYLEMMRVINQCAHRGQVKIPDTLRKYALLPRSTEQ